MKSIKLSFLPLHLQLWLAATSSAYWVRGAAERALYYSVYVLEDLHYAPDTQPYDGWKIAPGCSGTRRGILGQKGRCNFAEFLDYTWAETRSKWREGDVDREGLDSKPDKSKIRWGQQASAREAEAMISAIMGAKYVDKTLVCNPSVRPSQYGYSGNVDATKFFPGEGLDYFGALDRFGPRAVALKADFDAAVKAGTITSDVNNPSYKAHQKIKDNFNNFYKQSETAAFMIVAFRVQDKWDHIKKGGKWQEKLGIAEPVWHRVVSGVNFVEGWDELHRDKTIDKMVTETHITKEAAAARYDAYMVELASSQTAQRHAAAIEAAERTAKALFEGSEGITCK